MNVIKYDHNYCNNEIILNYIFRGYKGKKLEDNMQCEIFQTILEEAKSSYDPDIVFEISNDNKTDLNNNIKQIIKWIKEWKKNNTASPS